MSDEERKVSDLELHIINGPRLCGVTGANEKRWSKQFHEAYLEEILNPDSVFKQEKGESIDSRLDVLKGLFMAAGAVEAKVSLWIGLIVLRAHSHAIIEHGQEDLKETRDSIVTILKPMEEAHPEVAQYMTVEAAATQSNWS